MGVKLKGIREKDGSTVEVNYKDLETDVATKVPYQLFKYNYNNTPTAPPSSSQVRSDTNQTVDVTKIWIHRVDNANIDNKFFFMQVKIGQQLYVQDVDNSDSHAMFTLLKDPEDSGSYVTFDVECSEVGGQPLQGTSVLVGIFL